MPIHNPAEPSDSNAVPPASASALLQTRELECWRGERKLFSKLSLNLDAGEIAQVRGANGCGKTTLLRTLCGLTLPEQGEVVWRGTPIDTDPAMYRAEVQYVGHFDGIKLELSAAENIDFNRALLEQPSTLTTPAILEHLALSGFDDAIVRTLSAGQRRRIALARLLTANATLWVLDEPFTALDDAGEAIVKRMLVDHLSNGGLVVFSSHHPVTLDGFTIRDVELTP